MISPLDVRSAAEELRPMIGAAPSVGIVLGSGLGAVEEQMENPLVVPFAEVPGYPQPGVAGHAGRYVAGRLAGVDVLLQCGRFHAYEGHPPAVVSAPVRVAAALGVHTMVFTNAAGAIRRSFRPGSIVLVSDHINGMFTSPLVGPVREAEQRFPDMGAAYDPELRRLAREAALAEGESLEEGIYVSVLGPSYETPAEVRMWGKLGADLVGMSTVPEVLVARALGLRCLAFSVVTNMAAGIDAGTLSHGEVIEGAGGAAGRLAGMLRRVLPMLASRPQSGSTK